MWALFGGSSGVSIPTHLRSGAKKYGFLCNVEGWLTLIRARRR
jgi:hypothetical protein